MELVTTIKYPFEIIENRDHSYYNNDLSYSSILYNDISDYPYKSLAHELMEKSRGFTVEESEDYQKYLDSLFEN